LDAQNNTAALSDHETAVMIGAWGLAVQQTEFESRWEKTFRASTVTDKVGVSYVAWNASCKSNKADWRGIMEKSLPGCWTHVRVLLALTAEKRSGKEN
jgi:hypothetical protein